MDVSSSEFAAVDGRFGSVPSGWLPATVIFHLVFQPYYFSKEINITLQLLAMDVSAQATMKDAAKCDKHCEWQISVNQQNAERILHFWLLVRSMSRSGPLAYHVANDAIVSVVSWYTFLFAGDEAGNCSGGGLKYMSCFGLPNYVSMRISFYPFGFRSIRFSVKPYTGVKQPHFYFGMN